MADDQNPNPGGGLDDFVVAAEPDDLGEDYWAFCFEALMSFLSAVLFALISYRWSSGSS
jgi:hypothetical protein